MIKYKSDVIYIKHSWGTSSNLELAMDQRIGCLFQMSK